MIRNPLESLGVPKYIVSGIWGDTSLTEEQRVERLMEIIKQVYRGLQRSFHTDVAGENPYIREITEAFEDIESEALPGIIKRYITTADLQREREVQEARDQVDLAKKRASVLLPFLRLTDWREVAGDGSPVELVFGLPENLWDADVGYLNTYLLACTADEQTLIQLPHPNDGDPLVDMIARFSRAPEWRDGEWLVNDFDYSAELSSPPKTFHFGTPRQVGPVRLVGQVRPATMHALAASQGKRQDGMPGGAMPILGSIPRSTLSDKVVWWEPFGAWWLPGLEPQLQHGNYTIVAKGEGAHLRLAVLGRYLNSRPLA